MTGKTDTAAIDSSELEQTLPGAVNQLVRMIDEGSASTDGMCRKVCAAAEKLGMAVLQEKDTESRTIGEWTANWSVFSAAVGSGRDSLCRVCCELGADVNEEEQSGVTPLFIACWTGHLDSARLLLDFGADVNKATDNGATSLWITCFKNQLGCARLLLE